MSKRTVPVAVKLSQILIVGVALAADTNMPVKTPGPLTTRAEAAREGVHLEGFMSISIIVLC